MNKNEENISIEKITELLKKAPTDDGTFYSAIYDLYVLIGIAKGIDDINNGRGMPLEEFEKERKALYESYSRKFGWKLYRQYVLL